MQTWLIDLLVGIGLFFLHPLTYCALLAMVWIGLQRVKRERKMFHTSIGSWTNELLYPLFPGLLIGILLSFITVLLGVMLTPGYLLITAVLYILLLLAGGARFLSPAYALLLALAIEHWFLPLISAEFTSGLGFIDEWLLASSTVEPIPVLITAALFIFAEGILLRMQKNKRNFSPQRMKSKRGKWIGGQRFDRIWLVPLFLFIPGETIAGLEWWPILPVSGDMSIALVPFLIGHHASARSEQIGYQVARTGTQLLSLAILTMLSALAIYFQLWLLPIAIILLLLIRVLIQCTKRMRDQKQKPYFTPRSDGVAILAIRPGSPAEKMGLKPGEIVTKVHAEHVNSEWSFYQKLQINPAYGRVEVIDERGEKRIEQAALYDDQHHELGIIFLKPEENEEWEKR